MEYSSLVITGSIAWDIIMDFPSRFVDYLQPDKLHQINVSFVVERLEKQLGGTGTNIAYNASLATEKKITLLGAVGKDGDAHVKFFKKHGISTDAIIRDNSTYCATGSVITDIKDNQIWGFYYGACEKGVDVAYETFLSDSTLLIISANYPATFKAVTQEAVAKKTPYIYDPGMSLSWIKKEDLRAGVNSCTYLVGNDYEISMIEKMLGESVSALVKKGISVAVTLGEKGVRYCDAATKKCYYVPAYRRIQAVDPTGAGDAWRGAFMAGLIEKKPLEVCLLQANALASFAVEHVGTVNHTPKRSEIAARAKELEITVVNN